MTTESEWTDTSEGAAANDEWSEVESEAQIVIEVISDGFIGRYMGMDPPNANGIIQAHFNAVLDLQGESIADSAFINATTDLRNKLAKVPSKAIVRAEWVSELDTGHESGNKMRVWNVKWKR